MIRDQQKCEHDMVVHIRDSNDPSVAHSGEIHLQPRQHTQSRGFPRLGISEIASIFGEGLEHLRQQAETKSDPQTQIC